MFNRSSAFIVCKDSAWAKSFHSVLTEIGFAQVEHFAEAESLNVVPFSRPLQFCFLTQISSNKEVRAAMQAIREHRHERHRFSPVVMLSRDLPRQQIYEYIAMGIDDILQFPCSLKFMTDRLKRQMFQPVKYFETEDYLGPDRRRTFDDVPKGESEHAAQRTGMADYRRYLFQRNPFKGVKMLDIYEHRAEAEAEEGDGEMITNKMLQEVEQQVS
ncbi:hypothetical protein [Maritalea mediterranea]|uniref:Response regulatory domain-containing protein n=1 Tax=Maritalea mediterranea TaxID=2909667 RepID=A0ABS9E9Q8_9HYPH|nr:hypothetical protein [Maritalea mediterranea]MCF4099606.1 hypothetical protein [Maritalea mediterranea]